MELAHVVVEAAAAGGDAGRGAGTGAAVGGGEVEKGRWSVVY